MDSPPAKAAKKSTLSAIRRYLNRRRQRRHIFPLAALVGFCAGAVAIVFRGALALAEDGRSYLIEWAHHHPLWAWLLPMLFTAAGATMSLLLVRRYAPETKGSGIPHLEAVLRKVSEMRWRRVMSVKFLGGLLSVGGGLVLGREGPTVQIGGAVGDAVARGLKRPEPERLTLIAAGAGAGLAAAFNAPLSGLMFVLEEVQRDFQPMVFGAAFLAAAVADVVARVGADPFPVFLIPKYPAPPLIALPAFALLGVAAGMLSIPFHWGLLKCLDLYERARNRLLAVAATGAAVGLIAWFAPDAIGSGHPLTVSTLTGETALLLIPLWFVVRLVLTVTSYGTGVPGGIFAPLLVLGALIGLGVGKSAEILWPAAVPVPAVFAVVGMAAYFTAIVRAPLTGIVLIIEMTSNYEQMLPLLVSCFFAYAIANWVNGPPIYEILLERDLGGHEHHGRHHPHSVHEEAPSGSQQGPAPSPQPESDPPV